MKNQNQKQLSALSEKQLKARNQTQWSGVFLCALMMMIIPDVALAAANPIENGINAAIDFINSGVIRGLGILAVFSLGIAAYLGKLGWDLALKIVAGIILTFGAAGIVDMVSTWVN